MEVDRLKRKYKEQKEKLCYLQLTCRAQEDRIDRLELACRAQADRLDRLELALQRSNVEFRAAF